MRKRPIAVFVTCGSVKEARLITGSLLKKRLVACATILPGAESRFWWDGRINMAKEALVIMKTTVKSFPAVERETRRLHSYDVPEVVAVPLCAGSGPYLKWIRDTVA